MQMDAGAALLIFGVVVFLITVFRERFKILWDWVGEQNEFAKIIERERK